MGWEMAEENHGMPRGESNQHKEEAETKAQSETARAEPAIEEKPPVDFSTADVELPQQMGRVVHAGNMGRPKKKLGCLAKLFIGVVALAVVACIGTQIQRIQEENSVYTWPSSGLATLLPEPESKNGQIASNDNEHFRVEIMRTGSSAYAAYVEACKEMGFTLDSTSLSTSYWAYNDKGDELRISFNDSWNKMSIRLDAGEEMSDIAWPTMGIATQAPVPTSLIGRVAADDEDRYFVYLSMDHDAFDSYIETCIDAGYTVDYSRSEKNYRAKNGNGAQIDITYQGGNVVCLCVKAAASSRASDSAEDAAASASDSSAVSDESVKIQATDQDEQTTGSKQSGETSDTPIADAVSNATSDVVSADFKESIDSYESFMNDYCDFMVKYASAQSSNDTAALATMLADYTSLAQQEGEWIEKMNAIDTDSLSAADSAYYLAATARIEKRLAEIGQSNS